MAKILRVTRHAEISSAQAEALQAAANVLVPLPRVECTPVQWENLKEGGAFIAKRSHEVVVHDQTVKDAAEVLALCAEHGAAVVEAVLPPAILADLTNPKVNTSGIPVIRAQMAREVDAAGNATFTFTRYERIVKVEVVTEPL